MFFKRKIYSKLQEWKNESHGSRALLIEGARRVGKSTIVREFAQNEYKSYLLIDFSQVGKEIIEAFETKSDNLGDLFMLLSAYYGVKLYPRESLIIFDEIQKYPHARELVKYFVADGRYDYIETGSLISIKENVKDIVIPSEERHLTMHPFDFEEFAWALGEEPLIDYIKMCFNEKTSLERSMHNKAMLIFKQYMLVGGMPDVIVTFIESNKDFGKADEAKRDIINLYRDDIRKIDKNYQSKVQALFDQIPGYLSKHEKRVRISNLGIDSRAIQYENTFFWLADSMICNECFNCNDPNIGLAMNLDQSHIKCYMGDTGLLVSHAFAENELTEQHVYKNILFDKLSINEGMLFENAIAQELVAKGHKLYFYTSYNHEKKRNDIEIDFIISNKSKLNEKIFPIEVKSGKKYTAKSLERFNEKFKNRIGESYIIHPKNYRKEGNIIYLPPYMTFLI